MFTEMLFAKVLLSAAKEKVSSKGREWESELLPGRSGDRAPASASPISPLCPQPFHGPPRPLKRRGQDADSPNDPVL